MRWTSRIDTSHKQQQILDGRKNQQNTPSSFDWSYMYCHLQLKCDFFGEQWEQIMCCHVSQILIIKNILILFWNNLKHLILCLDGLDRDTWCNIHFPCGIFIEFFQIKFKSIFMYVGWTRYLSTYIPTYPSWLNTYLDRTYLLT
jgi:hypothetical protein